MAVGKYGRPNHGPRCACPDCNNTFLTHNRVGFCGCYDCAAHREIGAPLPPTTTMTEQVAALQEAAERLMNHPPQREAERMSTVHMCSRKGCGAIMTQLAMGVVQYRPSMEADADTLELCPACSQDVHNLLHSKPSGERERGYEAPFRPEEGNSDEESEARNVATEDAMGAALLRLLRRAEQRELEAGPRTIVDSDVHDAG